jgi:hypothetical protein
VGAAVRRDCERPVQGRDAQARQGDLIRSMIRKTGNRFSEKIVLKQRVKAA